MTARHILPHLQRWAEVQSQAQSAWSALETVTGYTDSESPIGRAIWGTFHAYTETLAALIGDSAGWLEWYHLENCMGAHSLTVTIIGHRRREIRSLRDLAWVIATLPCA